jgi:hypothetical protein
MLKALWTVKLSRKADKSLAKLPKLVTNAFALLMSDIEAGGPVCGDWPNYSRLDDRRHHCHLKKGQPTYVAVWEETEVGVRLVEVVYVGTHEKAPY